MRGPSPEELAEAIEIAQETMKNPDVSLAQYKMARALVALNSLPAVRALIS